MKKKTICKRAEARALVCTAQLLSRSGSEGDDREGGRVSLRAAANVVIAANRISDGERASTTEI